MNRFICNVSYNIETSNENTRYVVNASTLHTGDR